MQCSHRAPAGKQLASNRHLLAEMLVAPPRLSTCTSHGRAHNSSRPCYRARASPHDLEAKLEELRAMVATQHATLQDLQARLNAQSTLAPRAMSPFEAQAQGSFGDRRLLGLFDARFHSTASGATPKDYRVLPDRIFLVRHAESEGNVDNTAYAQIPDSQVPLTERGKDQARHAGWKIRRYIEQHSPGGQDYQLFFYTSPYKRSLQTYEHIISAFSPDRILGVQEEVQLREQDFGNFQDPQGKQHEKMERLRFGRFFYRFPDGESGADVYDRLTIFEDHLIRDINAGRFSGNMNLVLVTHGLALRIFLMRWFHWSVDEFLQVFNPPNAEPLVLERVPSEQDARPDGAVSWVHTKALYALSPESMRYLRGCSFSMCTTSHFPRTAAAAAAARTRREEAAVQAVLGHGLPPPAAAAVVAAADSAVAGITAGPPQLQQQVEQQGGEAAVASEVPHPPPHHEVAVNCSILPRQHQEVDVVCETSTANGTPAGSPAPAGAPMPSNGRASGTANGVNGVSTTNFGSSSSSREPMTVASAGLAATASPALQQPTMSRTQASSSLNSNAARHRSQSPAEPCQAC